MPRKRLTAFSGDPARTYKLPSNATVCRSSGAPRTTFSYSSMAGSSLPMRSSFCALRRTAARSRVMKAAASGLEVDDDTIQRLELVHIGKQRSRANISLRQVWLENCGFVSHQRYGRPPAITELVAA